MATSDAMGDGPPTKKAKMGGDAGKSLFCLLGFGAINGAGIFF